MRIVNEGATTGASHAAVTGTRQQVSQDATPLLVGADVEDAVEQVDFDNIERESALTALFDAHAAQLTRLAALLGAGAESEDIVAEAFYRVHRRWGRLRDPRAALPYLRATVCNLARQRHRHLQVVRRHDDQSQPVDAWSAEAEAVLREDQQEVVAALRLLPLRQRQVVVLRYWLDLRECDVAEALGISVGAVKSHASRAMASLARALGHRR